jgi:hypothetical protein
MKALMLSGVASTQQRPGGGPIWATAWIAHPGPPRAVGCFCLLSPME